MNKWLIFWIVGMANFIAGFSINSMNLALPGIAAQFCVSQTAVSYLSLVYNLIPCCLLLFFGRLGDIFGFKKQFIYGFILFGLVSYLAPIFSYSIELLIVFRCFQGLAYSIIVSITQAMVKKTFPKNECGKAIGINSVFVSIGLASGPTLGGFLIDYFSWHSIFYVNIPFCITGIIASIILLPADRKKTEKSGIDITGTVLFTIFTGTFIIGINNSNIWGWTSAKFILIIITAFIALGLFIIKELNSENYLLPLKLFTNRNFTLACLVCACSYFTQQSVTYLMPFFLIKVMELSASQAGIIMLLSPISMMISSPWGGALSDKIGVKKSASTGLSVICVCIILICISAKQTGIITSSLAMLLMGIGNGFSVAAINSCILCSVPDTSTGTASAIIGTLRNFGQCLGIATGTAIIAAREKIYTVLGDNFSYLHAQRDAFIFTLLIILISIILTLRLSERKN